MMKTKTIAAAVFAALALNVTSCKTETPGSTEAQPTQAAEQSTSKPNEPTEQSADQTSGTAHQPADRWTGKLNELLTLEMAANSSGHAAPEAQEKYQKSSANPASHSIKYSWKKGREEIRKDPISGTDVKVPVDDTVEVAWVRDSSLSKFKASYRTPTQQELADAKTVAGEKLDKMKDEGRTDAEQSQAAKAMASTMGQDVSYDQVDGVGDYAVWNNKAKELRVFTQGLEFQVRTAVSDDEAVNRQKSIELAQQIIKEKLST